MLRLLLASAALVPCLAQQVDTGMITGTVSGDDGSPVVRAYVTLHLSFTGSQSVRRSFQTQWGIYSGPGGSFRFTGLRNGTYRLCVQAPGTAWLDPCEWGLPIPSVVLAGAERSPTIAISLRKGVEVPIRIDDPGQFLVRNEDSVPGAHLLVGVRTQASTFRPATLVSQDGTGRTLRVVIPFEKPAQVAVASSFFSMADGNGAPFSRPGIGIPVSVPAGQKAAILRLSVTGAR